jgi:LacI family transcriptional regulator
MATIKDVAKVAGVSEATVSRWMNGRLTVRQETAERIESAVRSLEYAPSLVAQTLVTKTSRTLGVLLADISNPFFASLTRTIEDAAQSLGYAVIVCNSESDPDKEMNYIQLLTRKYIDGILFLSNSKDGAGIRNALTAQIPLVIVDEDLNGVDLHGVFVDNTQGAYEGVSHLIALGHRRIAHIAGLPVYTTPLRLEGYKRALEAHGISFERSLIRFSNFQAEGGREAAAALLANADRPTAVFAGNDLMALGVIQAVWEAGLRVPEDVAVVGFDDIPLAASLVPPLTTVAQPISDIGSAAVRMLVALIEGRDVQERVVLPCTLRVRHSCGAGLRQRGTDPTDSSARLRKQQEVKRER